MERTLPLTTWEETHALALMLAPQLRPGDVVALAGDLGAGKTSFARCLIGSLSPLPVDVTSPTFTLLQTYPIKYGHHKMGEAWHYDLYRVEHPSALVELGLEEAAQHLTIIEWPERLSDYPLAITITLFFELLDSGARQVTVRSDKEFAL